MPTIPDLPPRDRMLRARLRGDELARLRAAARACDVPVSHLVRRAALDAADRILAEART